MVIAFFISLIVGAVLGFLAGLHGTWLLIGICAALTAFAYWRTSSVSLDEVGGEEMFFSGLVVMVFGLALFVGVLVQYREVLSKWAKVVILHLFH